jgi:hypothetical protein
MRGSAQFIPQREKDMSNNPYSTAQPNTGSRTEQVAAGASEQVHQIGEQVRTQVDSLTDTVQDQITRGKENLVGTLRQFGADFERVAPQTSGAAATITGTVGRKTNELADWLQSNEPSDVVHTVGVYVYRRPIIFLGATAVAGVLVGRAARGLLTSDGEERTPARTEEPGEQFTGARIPPPVRTEEPGEQYTGARIPPPVPMAGAPWDSPRPPA